MFHAMCRGIVMADVLVEGLSRGAIATGYLKGRKADKGRKSYTGSDPFNGGKSLCLVVMGLLGLR